MAAKMARAVLALWIASASLALAEEAGDDRVRLAVIDLAVGEGVSADEGKLLTLFIRDAIVKTAKFEVMDRQRVADIFAEQHFSEAMCDTTKCLVKAGKLLDVNRIVGGRAGRFGNNWSLVLSLVDVNLGKLINSRALGSAGSKENLLSYAPAVALTLLGLEGAPAGPAIVRALPASAPAPTQAGQPLALDLGHGVKLDLVWIPPGEFDMGSNDGDSDEKPVRRVRISRGFWMGKYEVTQAQYEVIMGINPASNRDAQNPVENVSWDDAQTFCQRLNGMGVLPAGVIARLPTEAEWEYACRAGTTTKYHTGDRESDLARAAWYSRNSGGRTHPVGQKQPNRFGLYDMLGNVWEWCADWHGPYRSFQETDPAGPDNGSSRVLRGGSFNFDSAYARAANRADLTPVVRSDIYGFRVCGGGVP